MHNPEYKSGLTSEPSARTVGWLGPNLLIPALTILIIAGSWAMGRPGLMTRTGNESSGPLSLFGAVNIATCTGFKQPRNPADFTPTGQWITLVLMTGGILFSTLAGGLAVVRIARLPFRDWHVAVTTAATLFVVGIGGGMLLVVLRPGAGSLGAAFDALSAFGHCGLTLDRQPPTPSSARTVLVLLPLVALGGLGVPVLMDMAVRFFKAEKLSPHTAAVLFSGGTAYLVTFALLLLLQLPWLQFNAALWKGKSVESPEVVPAFELQKATASASAQAINCRSAGFNLEPVSKLPQATAGIVILCMILGAAPGSAGGGIKVTTPTVLVDGTRQILAGRPVGRPFALAMVWVGLYCGLLLIATLAIWIVEPSLPPFRSLFLVTSALGNVGLSFDPVDVSTPGLYILSLTMLIGRVAPVLMLWYLADTTPQAIIATA